jgi:NAD-dependent dihydropyrimidine dehydrogenase PreA subunit
MKIKRKIIEIDESLCSGCGECVEACAEGAIQIIDGKAKLVSEIYCDGLGACLGECPQGAITIEKREAVDYDEQATRKHLASIGRDPNAAHRVDGPGHASAHAALHAAGGCPGSRMRTMKPKPQAAKESGGRVESRLAQWPVQLTLVPPTAPYFRDADLLVTADCVPFAYAEYHRDFLDGKAVVVGCPKLDDIERYRDKLAQIFEHGGVRSVTVLKMEVPCCGGILHATLDAVKESGRDIPVTCVTIGIGGEILEREQLAATGS